MDFLLTYKLSQNHLEMFFSAIRSKGGFNNNPTAAQLEAAYKRLIVHKELATSSEANCLPIDRTNILTISSTNKFKNEEYLDMLCAEVESDNDGNFLIDQTELQYTHNVIEYIAGFVSRKLKKKCYQCDQCILVIINNSESIDKLSTASLLNIKNKGRLTKLSEDVVKICKIAESTFKTNIGKISKQENIIQYVIIKSSAYLKIYYGAILFLICRLIIKYVLSLIELFKSQQDKKKVTRKIVQQIMLCFYTPAKLLFLVAMYFDT